MPRRLFPAAPINVTPVVDEKEAAKILGTTPGTLAVWRCNRAVQIPFVKIGRSVRYRLADLDAFLEAHTVSTITTTSKVIVPDVE
jgi:excisionase family DNA binding protein